MFGLYDAKHGDYVRRAHAGLDDVWEEVRKKRIDASDINDLLNPEFRISNSYFVSHNAVRQTEHDFVVVSEERTPLADEWHDNDMLIVPLMSGDQVIGYLSVRQPHDRRVPSIEKVQTLEIFAAQAVTALQSARQVDEIKRLTFIDALTPAFNHRYFQEALAKEIHRHSRTGHEFALAMLDIDNFKRINDTFGDRRRNPQRSRRRVAEQRARLRRRGALRRRRVRDHLPRHPRAVRARGRQSFSRIDRTARLPSRAARPHAAYHRQHRSRRISARRRHERRPDLARRRSALFREETWEESGDRRGTTRESFSVILSREDGEGSPPQERSA